MHFFCKSIWIGAVNAKTKEPTHVEMSACLLDEVAVRAWNAHLPEGCSGAGCQRSSR